MLRRSNGNTRLATTTTTRAAAGACLITFFLLLSLQWTKLISASPPSLTNKLTQLKQQQRSEYQVDDSWEEQPKAAAQHARLDDYDTSLTTNDDDDDQANQDYQDDLDVPYEQLKDKLHQQHEQQLKQHSLDQDAFEWDVLVFTQQWPVTTCYHWREEDKNHECKLPSKKEFWTIHGIWPTKIGHFGPNFCNKTADFDLDKLQRILAELQQFWPDIDGEDKNNQNWLWKHEWLKHGTCAALLAQLDNELKYFEQALDWREDYLISNMLGAANIHPDSNNTVVALQTALFKALGHNPSIHCLYDIKNDVSYLAEIRICFNKLLKLTDCDGVKLGDAVRIDYPGGNVITNCHISKPVHYPSLVPAWQRKQNEKWKFPIVNMYKLLRFIMWLTL